MKPTPTKIFTTFGTYKKMKKEVKTYFRQSGYRFEKIKFDDLINTKNFPMCIDFDDKFYIFPDDTVRNDVLGYYFTSKGRLIESDIKKSAEIENWIDTQKKLEFLTTL